MSRKLLGRFGNTFGKIFADKIIRTKELYKEFLERSKAIAGIDEKTKEQKPYITDVIVLDVDDAKFKTKTSDNYLKDYKAAVNSAVDRYVKYGKDHGLNIDMSNVSITIQTVDVSAIKKNKKLPTLYVYSNG